MKKKVLIVQNIHNSGIELLKKYVEVTVTEAITEDALSSECKDCFGIFVRTAKITRKVIESSNKLKVIAKHGVGVDNIDVDAATEKGIHVINAPNSNHESVAEHVLGMTLALAKNFLVMDSETRNGNYHKRNQNVSKELKGKTAGIIGLGKIGITVARKMRCLDVKIIAFDPYADLRNIDDFIEVKNNLNDIYELSDLITIHIPLNKETRKLIGSDEFGKMKKDCIFINTSRGEIVDETALYNALKTNEIKKAGIDVFEDEPPDSKNPLFGLDNILISPHNAALTEEALERMATEPVQDILRVMKGLKPVNLVNIEVMNNL